MAVQGTCLGWLAEMVLKNKGLDRQSCGTLVLAVAYHRLAVCATTFKKRKRKKVRMGRATIILSQAEYSKRECAFCCTRKRMS